MINYIAVWYGDSSHKLGLRESHLVTDLYSITSIILTYSLFNSHNKYYNDDIDIFKLMIFMGLLM